MPWLVVLGTGSWSAPGLSKTTFKAAVCKATGKAYEVDQAVADAATATGYWWLQAFEDDDEPVLEVTELTGALGLEDIRHGVHGGVRLHLVAALEEEPDYSDPDAPPAVHECKWCPRKFPSTAARERHVEFEHTRRHEKDVAQSIEEYEAAQAERAEIRRLADAEEPLPPWEREVVEKKDEPLPPAG